MTKEMELENDRPQPPPFFPADSQPQFQPNATSHRGRHMKVFSFNPEVEILFLAAWRMCHGPGQHTLVRYRSFGDLIPP